MSVSSPALIRERYSSTDIRRVRGGLKVLVNLPKNSREGLEEAARILSSHDCRGCSKCCAGGFSFKKKDPNYEKIMDALAGKSGFSVKRRSFMGEETFLVRVPTGVRACPLLEGVEPAYSELDLMEGPASDKVKGCMIYSCRPSVCVAYPFVWDVLEEKYWKFMSDESFAAIDPGCPAVFEVATIGIGHFTLSEIEAVVDMGAGKGGMLASLRDSLEEVRRRAFENGSRSIIFRNEGGEEVYPLNFSEISHPLQEEERC